jgi:hypothetical protein
MARSLFDAKSVAGEENAAKETICSICITKQKHGGVVLRRVSVPLVERTFSPAGQPSSKGQVAKKDSGLSDSGCDFSGNLRIQRATCRKWSDEPLESHTLPSSARTSLCFVPTSERSW